MTKKIIIFFIVAVFAFFIAGFVEAALEGVVKYVIPGVFIFVLLEEAVKVLPIKFFKLFRAEMKIYLIITAAVFSALEFALSPEWALPDLLTFGGIIRLIPHPVFASTFYLAGRRSLLWGYLAASAVHMAWNYIAIFVFN